MAQGGCREELLDRDRTIMQTLTATSRAAADIVLTYRAAEVARKLS